jgi:tetratricopeptide (TPR) repeat protein
VSKKFCAVVLFWVRAVVQQLPFPDGISLEGEVRSSRPMQLKDLCVELDDSTNHDPAGRMPLDFDGRFHFEQVPPGRYSLRAVFAPGDAPLFEESRQIDPFSCPLIVEMPERSTAKPTSGIVSLRELQHPPQKKAIRALLEAQQYWKAHDAPKAIAKLEEATRIDPSFREAHINLGVQYARTKRVDEALGQFHTALAIGPPDAVVYSNLAWGYAALGQFRDAEMFARKAVALTPENGRAQYLLRFASTH